MDYRSYIEYECAKAVEAGIKIVVIYNSTTVGKSKCPDVLKSQGKHIPIMCYQNGAKYWNYFCIARNLEEAKTNFLNLLPAIDEDDRDTFVILFSIILTGDLPN